MPVARPASPAQPVEPPPPSGVGEPDARSWAANRRIGYRILPGEGYSYVLHLRPREWPIVAAHTLFGFLLAIPELTAVIPRLPAALFGTAVFVVLLNGGTLAINSAFDRDEGDIGYLDRPPPPPRHLFAFGLGIMLLGLAIAMIVLPPGFAWVYAACLVMSIAYSVPPFRWKAVAGLDLGINALGFGFLTPLAGWMLSGASAPVWALLVMGGFGPLFAALYPLTQLYQLDEDRERGDRTLALVLGVRTSIGFALAMVVVAFATIATGLWIGPAGVAAALVAFPFAVWTALLLRWLRDCPTMSPADHKRGMYRALQAWAVTNAVVLLAVLL